MGYIKDLRKDQEVVEFFMVKACAVKTGSNGKQYLDITLGDKTGELSGKKWDVSDGEYPALVEIKEKEIERLENTFASPTEEINKMLEEKGTVPLKTGTRFADLIRRPQLSINDILPFDEDHPNLSEELLDKINKIRHTWKK